MQDHSGRAIACTGYVLVLLLLVCFLLVGLFIPNPEAGALDAVLTLLSLLAVTLFVLRRWVFSKP